MTPPFVVRGREFVPRGINLGSWLNIEDFMLGTPGTEWQVLREWERFCGVAEARAWHEAYLDAFLTDADLAFLAGAGFNCVRLPIHWRRLEPADRPGEWLADGFSRIQWLLDAADRHGLLVLLDLHVAPGGQNTTPPADNTWGCPMLWSEEVFQGRVVAIWEELARRFAGHPATLGFNLLNEPQINQYGPMDLAAQAGAMNALYLRVISAIRRLAPEVWIVLDAPLPREALGDHFDREVFEDPRVAWSFHHYPLANWEGGINTETIRPEGDCGGRLSEFLKDRLHAEMAFAETVNRPVILGEFGRHRDWGTEDEALRVVDAQIAVCESLGFGWMVWSYKDIGAMGLVSPAPDTPWRKWVDRPEWTARVREEMQSMAAFRRAAESWLPYDASSARLHDFAYGLSRIAQSTLLNHRFFADFAAAFPGSERVAMADAFRFQNCGVAGDYLAVLQGALARTSVQS